MKIIELTQGRLALVDDEDYDFLMQWRWYAANYHNYYYAVTEKKGIQMKMHRLILNPPPHLKIDHKDNNGLNNQRSNLRLCTSSQNSMNTKKCIDGRSRYKGVWLVNEQGKARIRAAIRVNGILISLGSHKTEIEAAMAYNNAASLFFGPFAKLNEI